MGFIKFTSACLAAGLALAPVGAAAEVLTLDKLTGVTGSSPLAQTAVYRADLSSLAGEFAAITISDTSGNLGGATGQFSGFDLDAVKLSNTFCMDATCAAGAASLNVFDFLSGVVFSPGTQRPPTDPKLFGTGPLGNTIDNSVATLGLFDGVSSTATPAGFVSLGDGGSVAFNLSSMLSGSGLYLYLGEVGDNGEVINSAIETHSTPVSGVPEPATWAMLLLGFGLIGGALRRRSRLNVSYT